MNSKKIKIEIWSDVVCPFCYIGKKKLERTISKLDAEDKVEIIWRSFQLAPNFPRNKSIFSTQYLSETKGYSVSQLKGMYEQLSYQGKSYGINFQFEKAISFNTHDVHRLIQWSKTLNKANELEEAFMIAYFTDGFDLSLHENTLKIVEKVGLNKTKAKQVLESNQFSKEVDQDIDKARSLEIEGVPYFLFNNDDDIPGAQSDGVFENVLSAALNEFKSEQSSSADGMCSINKKCN
jgi:predicted DsbA family dithiol-disulfide isomerase